MPANRDALPLVVIAHEDPGIAETLRHAVDAGAGWRATVVAAGPEALTAALTADATVALVGCGRLGELPPAAGVPVLAVGDDSHTTDYRVALESGARGLITWPDGAADLAGELARLAFLPREEARVPGCTVVAVAGVQGGVGTTTLAAHLAGAWARWGPSPVLLADLAGGAGFRLDLGGGARTWSSFAPLVDGMDGRLLTEMLTTFWPELAVLPLASLPDGAAEPQPEPQLVAAVLEAARTSYRVVVVDLPPRPGAAGEVALAAADVVLAVARLDSAGLHALEAVATTWGVPEPRRHGQLGLVVTGSGAAAPLSPREARLKLGQRIWGMMPADAIELSAAAEDGLLMLDRPEVRAVQAMLALANRVVPFKRGAAR